MRKIILFVLALALAVSFAGCGKSAKDADQETINTYLALAIKYIEKGETEKAISVLEDALQEEGDHTQVVDLLNQLMESEAETTETTTQATETMAPPTKALSEYGGSWTYASGVLLMDITASETGLNVQLRQNRESGASVAGFVPYGDAADNRISFGYSFFWGESGTVTLSFEDAKIVCTIAEDATYPEQGFTSGQFDFELVTPAPKINYSDYNGFWGTSGFSWTAGGVSAEIEFTSYDVSVEFNCVQSPPANRIAKFTASVPLADIVDGKFTVSYSNDGWGNSGFCTIDISTPNQITCDFQETNQDPSAMWGFPTGAVTMTKLS